MNIYAKRKQLGLLDYDNLPPDCNYIGRLPSTFSSDHIEYVEDFFFLNNFLVDRQWKKRNGVSIDWEDQCEIPIEAVEWFVNTIEEKFEKKPSDGGLPSDVLHLDATFKGEDLELRYGPNAGGEGIGGYTIYNFDRSGYIHHLSSQEFTVAIDTWRSVGRDFFKDIVRRWKAGEFNT